MLMSTKVLCGYPISFRQIANFYDREGMQESDVFGVEICRQEGNEELEEIIVSFMNGTYDVWQWVVNPESKDPRYLNHWGRVEAGVSDEIDEPAPKPKKVAKVAKKAKANTPAPNAEAVTA